LNWDKINNYRIDKAIPSLISITPHPIALALGGISDILRYRLNPARLLGG
jgi:hypothetical protein